MRKAIVISEQDSIAALLENDRAVEFFVNRGELLLGDIYTASVENILPGIDAAFVNLGKDKMGFLHANDVPGQGPLKERLVPKQKLLVQITKEPTGHKGPRVSTAISLPGRFLVLVPEERGVSISRRISEARERARLKAVVNLMKPPGVGLIIRTEAKGQGEQELFEDFEQLWDRWQTIVSEAESSIGPALIYRDQDLLFRVIRDAYSHEVTEIITDSQEGQRRAQDYLAGWAGKQTKVVVHQSEEPLLVAKGLDKEIEMALSDRAELPSGGHLNIQPTEALTVIDVNSGRFTSSRTQAETVRRTNLEAAQEIPRQLRLRNIGGMVIVDFIDMDSRKDQQQVLEAFQSALEDDRAKPQVGQLSDLGLVELTRRRQGQSLRELFSVKCHVCIGQGVIPSLEIGSAEHRRIISFRVPEEETRKGGRNRNRGGGHALKSASAHSGRVHFDADVDNSHAKHKYSQVSVEPDVHDHDHDLDDVPEDILAQMPEDMLDQRASGQAINKKIQFDDEHDEEGGEQEFGQVEQSKNADFSTPNFSEEEEGNFGQDLASDLAAHVSAVESVFQEMDAHAQSNSGQETEQLSLDLQSHDHLESADHDQGGDTADNLEPIVLTETALDQSQNQEQDQDQDQAQVDPVTGVYRLKPKSQENETGDGGQYAFANPAQTGEHETNPNHEPQSEYASEFTDYFKRSEHE